MSDLDKASNEIQVKNMTVLRINQSQSNMLKSNHRTPVIDDVIRIYL